MHAWSLGWSRLGLCVSVWKRSVLMVINICVYMSYMCVYVCLYICFACMIQCTATLECTSRHCRAIRLLQFYSLKHERQDGKISMAGFALLYYIHDVTWHIHNRWEIRHRDRHESPHDHTAIHAYIQHCTCKVSWIVVEWRHGHRGHYCTHRWPSRASEEQKVFRGQLQSWSSRSPRRTFLARMIPCWSWFFPSSSSCRVMGPSRPWRRPWATVNACMCMRSYRPGDVASQVQSQLATAMYARHFCSTEAHYVAMMLTAGKVCLATVYVATCHLWPLAPKIALP